MKGLILVGVVFLVLVGSVFAVECGSVPTNGCTVSVDTTFEPGTYDLPGTSSDGTGIYINDSVILDCNGAVLNTPRINLGSVGGITIKNCVFNIGNPNRRFITLSGDNNYFIHNIVNGGSINDATIYIEGCFNNNQLINNTIIGSPLLAVAVKCQGEVILNGNTIKDNNIGIWINWEHFGNLIIKNNNFISNKNFNWPFGDGTIFNIEDDRKNPVTLDVTENYWGTNNGLEILASINKSHSGAIVYDPYLCEAWPTDKLCGINFCQDSDNDGYYAYDILNCPTGNDCDDNNVDLHTTLSCNYDGSSCGSYQLCALNCPTAPEEVCDDNIDNNCNNQTDENCATLFDEAIALYHFDKDTNFNENETFVHDFSGNNYNLISVPGNTNIPQVVSGKLNSAYYWQKGTKAFLRNSDALDNEKTVSVAFWFNMMNDGTDIIFSKGLWNKEGYYLQFSDWNDNLAMVFNRAGANEGATCTDCFTGKYNQWNHLAMVITPNSISWYRNGEFLETDILVNEWVAPTNALFVGTDAVSANFDELVVWNRALTLNEISELYNSYQSTPVCVDSDGDGYYAYDPVSCVSGNDCNDNNSLIHPGAVEICDDGEDNNCNGLM